MGRQKEPRGGSLGRTAGCSDFCPKTKQKITTLTPWKLLDEKEGKYVAAVLCANKTTYSITNFLEPVWAECLLSSTLSKGVPHQKPSGSHFSVDSMGQFLCSTSEALACFW